MDDGSASVFCFNPVRVTVSELDRLRAASSAPETSPDPVCSAPAIPQGPCPVCPRLEQEFEPWRQASYWQAMHRLSLEREALLKAEVARLEALLRLREQQLFGRKTESSTATESAVPQPNPTDPPPRRSRGQQPGKPGPKRRDYSHLPAVVEDHQLAPEPCRGSRCGQPFAEFPGTEDSIILEIDVRAHRRVIRRRRYRPTCSCAAHPGLVTAPPPPRVIPKSLLGVSIWVSLLVDKYLFYRPTYRLLADWATHDLNLSLGTVTDGLKHLVGLFEPVDRALVRHSQSQTLWHADETRWLVFASIEGKVGYRWYLWVFHSAEGKDSVNPPPQFGSARVPRPPLGLASGSGT
jgi:transposase